MFMYVWEANREREAKLNMINKRLNDLSCNKIEFDKATPMYKKALISSGHDNKLKFDQNKNLPKRTRKRKTIWFNPPYSMSVQTNIGKIFFKLIDQHFSKNHKYHKIFNRNTLKMSYSCMSNMADRIKAHNNKILNQKTSQSITDSDEEKCNCRQKEECPLNGKCLTTAIVYQATVQYDGKTAKYIGLTEGDFKTRYKNHVKSFKHIK